MTTLRLMDGNTEVRFAVGGTNYDSPYLCNTYDLGFPEAREVSAESAGRSGMTDLTGQHNARTVAITGYVRNIDGHTRHFWLDRLRGMCAPSRRPWLYAQCEGWPQERRIALRANPLSCVVGPKNTWHVEVSLSFTAASGVFESTDPVVANPVYPIQGSPGLALTPGPAGSSALYLTPGGADGYLIGHIEGDFDDVGGGSGNSPALSLDPGTGANVLSVDNVGNAQTMPTFIITGPCTSPRIYNRTARTELSFTNLKIPAAHYVIADVARRTVLMDGDPAQNLYGRVNWATSRWFSLEPGETLLEFTAASSDDGCSLIVQHSPRWY